MTAYCPADSMVVVVLVTALAVVVAFGHALAFRLAPATARALAWAVLIFGTGVLEGVTRGSGAGFRMLALTSFALIAMKLVVLIEARASAPLELGFWAWLGFATAWLGMNPRPFAEAGSRPLAGALPLMRRGLGFLLLGSCALLGARWSWTATQNELLATVLALPGISLCLHFGLCNLLAGAWRWLGVDCQALFRAPLRAERLSEFWSKRWNLAFSEMTASAVYRPLGKRFGRAPALFAAFAVSGLLHELAISVPVQSGFGLPLLYFVLHGGLVSFERVLSARGWNPKGWVARVWVAAWLVAPLPLLLHRPFLAGVIWPLLGIEAG